MPSTLTRFAAGPQTDRNGFEHFPRRAFALDDWTIVVEALPGGAIDDHGRHRAVLSSGDGEMALVQNEESLRDAIANKASVCRGLDAPVIIAVLVGRNFGKEYQVENALLGTDEVLYTFVPDQLVAPTAHPARRPDGVWSRAGSYDHIVGVLGGVRLQPFSVAAIGPTLWTNPHVARTPLAVAAELPWQRRWIDEEGKPQASEVVSPASFFGLDQRWPTERD